VRIAHWFEHVMMVAVRATSGHTIIASSKHMTAAVNQNGAHSAA